MGNNNNNNNNNMGFWEFLWNGNKLNDGYWENGLFECSVSKSCLFSFLLPQIELLYQMKLTDRYGKDEAEWSSCRLFGNCLCACCCFPIALFGVRGGLVDRYNLDQNNGHNLFACCCCPCCALNQQNCEIKRRNEKPVTLFME
ncbi:hypothetical protein ACTA71_000983 [Dictyostelium dimigraforme]